MTNDESWDDEDEQRERDEMSERDVSDEDDDEAKEMTLINRHRKTRMDLLGILKEIQIQELLKEVDEKEEGKENKAGYTATEVACGWAGAIFEVARPFGQEQ